MIKELFHDSAEHGKVHLVSVQGVAGIGKSRLMWEFNKYIDGLAEDVWWHQGRCLAYGEGVAFWALAEMVRGRAGILEDEESSSALPKLTASIQAHIPDDAERRFVEPRLAHLLGLEEAGAGDQENLFAACRIFFERIADQGPSIMVFEDIHWADSALLDFIEYLVEWSRDHPIFVLTLARPELAERRPDLGSRDAELHVDLPRAAADEPGDGLLTRVPSRASRTSSGRGSSSAPRVSRSTRSRPSGCCSTAGCSCRRAARTGSTGPIETLEVPETLQALIAARLDGLEPRGAAAAPGRFGARQDVHACRAFAAISGLAGGRGRAAPRLARAQGGPVDLRPTRSRPSAGSTGSSRTS